MPKSLAAACFILLIATQAIAAPKPDQTLIYKRINHTQLKLHLFKPREHKASDNRPAIVFFFGGGWLSGSPKQFYKQSQYLASRGIVAICPEYRTQKSHHTSPKQCLQDAHSAIQWVRKNAKFLGIDPNRIAAAGGSAGGHLALATATCPKFQEPHEDKKISSKPNALVLFNPVLDNGPQGYGHQRVQAYWKDFSPQHNITQNLPPTIVYLGTKDQLVPVQTIQIFQKKMKKQGNRCDVIFYKGQKHAFFNKIKYTQTLLATDRFLISLKYLKGPPTLKARPQSTPHRRPKKHKKTRHSSPPKNHPPQSVSDSKRVVYNIKKAA